MENKEVITDQSTKKNTYWKKILKKFGIWGIVFFTVKGIITSTLIYFLGKNFWAVIMSYFAGIAE